METINNLANAASRAVWGQQPQQDKPDESKTTTESTQEPLSGVMGNTTKGEPYDAGNMASAQSEPLATTGDRSGITGDRTGPETGSHDSEKPGLATNLVERPKVAGTNAETESAAGAGGGHFGSSETAGKDFGTSGTSGATGSHFGSSESTGNDLGSSGAAGAHFGSSESTGHDLGSSGATGSHFGSSESTGHDLGSSGATGSHFGSSESTGNDLGSSGATGSHFGSSKSTGNDLGSSGATGAHFGSSESTGHGLGSSGATGAHFGSSESTGHGLGSAGAPGAHFGSSESTGHNTNDGSSGPVGDHDDKSGADKSKAAAKDTKADDPIEALEEGEARKPEGPGPRPLEQVAREHGGDAGRALESGEHKDDGSADSSSKDAKAKDGPEGAKGLEASEEEYVRVTGVQADGGDFDATKPGAGPEATRLLEEKGLRGPDGERLDNPNNEKDTGKHHLLKHHDKHHDTEHDKHSDKDHGKHQDRDHDKQHHDHHPEDLADDNEGPDEDGKGHSSKPSLGERIKAKLHRHS